jgi:DNA invertase Pin-like site-specific DNA recombinase
MTTYAYARISKPTQRIERQERNIIAAAPDAIIYKEAYTGTKQSRPEWNKLFKRAAAGDTIIFDSVSRMSRNAEEGFAAYEELFNRGINLVFLNEPHINTEVYREALKNTVPLTGSTVDFILEGVNRYLMELARQQIKIAFDQAEKEVADLHKRTAQGMETARLAGKQIGGKPGSTYTTKKSLEAKEQIKKHCRDFGGSLTDADCIKLLGISKKTYYKYKKELKETA